MAELVAVLRKHPNVYAEFGGLAPRYVCEPNTGWEVMKRFMNSLLSEQVLHGTDWPVFPTGKALAQWRAGGLRDHVLEALIGGNAARLLGRS
ncbi:MAG: amidohydrolase family protein [Streptosporangiaceae bacterium]